MNTTLTLPTASSGTLFGRIGNTFGWICVGGAAVLPGLGAFLRGRRANRPSALS